MTVLRVLQAAFALLTLFFFAMLLINLFSEVKSNGVGLYASLTAAGIIISFLLRLGIKVLKNHL